MTKTNTRKIAGFTLDQTILVVAVIAVLATIIISSVAWNVLNRANATKLNAHLTQINDAIGQYYQDNDFAWPSSAQDLAPYLAGYNIGTSGKLTTPFFKGSELTVTDGDAGGTRLATGAACGTSSSYDDCYITISITEIQVQELEKANEAIDGETEGSQANTKGRLRWDTGSGSTDRVKLTYYAVKLF
jgi:type II secretory pathway pseudopilin PulG